MRASLVCRAALVLAVLAALGAPRSSSSRPLGGGAGGADPRPAPTPAPGGDPGGPPIDPPFPRGGGGGPFPIEPPIGGGGGSDVGMTGGTPTLEATWIVRLGFPQTWCSGSLLTERWVLTSAHCVRRYTSDGLAGTARVKVQWTTPSKTVETLYNNEAAVFVHPDFTGSEEPDPPAEDLDSGDDVALVLLAGDVGEVGQASRAVLAAPPPRGAPSFSIIGWGLSGRDKDSDACEGFTSNVKRIGTGFRLEYSTGPTPLARARVTAGHTCSGDSGAAWLYPVTSRPMMYLQFAVHSARATPLGDVEMQMAAWVFPKLGWIESATRDAGYPLACPATSRIGGYPAATCSAVLGPGAAAVLR